MRPRSGLTGLAAVALMLAACQSGPATAQPGSADPGVSVNPGAGTNQPGATDGAAATGTLPDGIVIGPGEFVLHDPLVGVDGLASYRATLTESFAGTVDGQPSSWTITESLTIGRSPLVGMFERTTTGNLEADLAAELASWAAVRDGVGYAREEDGCYASVIEAGASGLAEPAAALTPILGADTAGVATVLGIEAQSYTFDHRALGFMSGATATGRISIATNGGYVVRYEVSTSGGPEYMGDGVTGTLHTVYELTEVDSAVAVNLPADCPPGFISLALPTDAAVVDTAPGLLRYTTPAGVEAAAAQVQGNAVIAHWTADGTHAIEKDFAHLAFTDGPLRFEVIIRPTGDGSEVQILASRP